MLAYMFRSVPRRLPRPNAQLRSLSTTANIPSSQYHPDVHIQNNRPKAPSTLLPNLTNSTTIHIPSYQHHPDYPPGIMPHRAAPEASYTTAYALFEALWEAGITTCFVNVGSDHPSIIEAIVKGKRERPNRWPRFITCPAEVTAISMADGYARVTGQAQAVVVHVDVGTQALGQGLHNASVGRAPVFIFAGLCPYTEAGELPGSRTEYMHWLQEAPDQKAIVRQYCRYTGEIRTGTNVKQTVARALQFANSAAKGPVYVASARETLAEVIEKPYILDQEQWKPIGPGALPEDAVDEIARALVDSRRPLIITGYAGRDRRCPEQLVALADLIPGLRVHDTGGSDLCFPFSHPASQGFRLGTDDCTQDADLILLIDCDVPWIPSLNPPPKDARIYQIDIDPLNERMPVSFFPAHGRWRAESYTAVKQILAHISTTRPDLQLLCKGDNEDNSRYQQKEALVVAHQQRLENIAARCRLSEGDTLDASNIGYLLKCMLPQNTVFVVEAVTCAQLLADQLQVDKPGHWIGCGATGIGWSNGAALGVRMAADALKSKTQEDILICQIVGDGSFMCAAPSSALWVASKYKIPILTVVLNNGGFKAPKNSTALVYPQGLNQNATDDEMNISFKPSPNYAALAEAASGSHSIQGQDGDGTPWLTGVQVASVASLKEHLGYCKKRILEEKKGMLIEALIP